MFEQRAGGPGATAGDSGLRHQGAKIARLRDLGDLRETLSAFEDPDALVQRYKRKELYTMARRAKVYLGGSKRLLACSPARLLAAQLAQQLPAAWGERA